jgi:hypothetical protein
LKMLEISAVNVFIKNCNGVDQPIALVLK